VTSDSELFTGLVAVIDDDASVRRALVRLLASMDVRAEAHASGPAFLASRALHDTDCLLLDVHMPRMSGMEVLEQVREAATKVPVVLMTGRYDPAFAERSLAAGAAAFLRKPFDEGDLISAIERATGSRCRS
jgi:FixJ family two-component response regulator